MRLLLDQDVYAATARLLRELGHDVITAGASGYSQASDAEILHFAQQQSRILITRDRDFGSLVFVSHSGSGVIYLRLHPTGLHPVHRELGRVLSRYPEDQLKRAFIVVEAGRHRYRSLPPLFCCLCLLPFVLIISNFFL